MNSVHFSDWLIHSLQKDLFKDPIQQEIADKIIKSVIENLTNIKTSHHEKKENEINFTKQAFEISWNHSLREIYSIKDMHFRSISADIDNTNWGYRRFVEGKIVLDTWFSYPSRQSWIQSCHSLLKQLNETDNYVWQFAGWNLVTPIRKMLIQDQCNILDTCIFNCTAKAHSGCFRSGHRS